MDVEDPFQLAEEHLSPGELEHMNVYRKEYRQHRNIHVGEDEESKRGIAYARSCRISGEFNFPDMVKTASMIRSIQQDEDEEEQEEYMNLPPLILSVASRRARKKSALNSYLNWIDPVLNNIGSLCFVFGSFYFVPSFIIRFLSSKEQGEMIGSIVFLIGCICYFITSVISVFRSGALRCEGGMGLQVNGMMYVIGNILFMVGCIYFIPPENELDTGLVCFIVGSVIYVIAPLIDAYRAVQLYVGGGISYYNLLEELFVITFYVSGSLMFVVGCIYYFPSIKKPWATVLFILGSICFLIATLAAPVMRLFRHWARLRKRIDSYTSLYRAEDHNVQIHISDYGSLYVSNPNGSDKPFVEPEDGDERGKFRSESVPDISECAADYYDTHVATT
jgi:hypothetical protein